MFNIAANTLMNPQKPLVFAFPSASLGQVQTERGIHVLSSRCPFSSLIKTRFFPPSERRSFCFFYSLGGLINNASLAVSRRCRQGFLSNSTAEDMNVMWLLPISLRWNNRIQSRFQVHSQANMTLTAAVFPLWIMNSFQAGNVICSFSSTEEIYDF